MNPQIEEVISKIEEEIRVTKKNKSTENHLALLKKKIIILKKKLPLKAKKTMKQLRRFKKEGDFLVSLFGFPNVGKSTLFNFLSGTSLSRLGDFEFTTKDYITAKYLFLGISFQIVDLPGIIFKMKDRRKFLHFLKISDLVLVVDDLSRNLFSLIDSLEVEKITFKEEKPIIKYKKKYMKVPRISFKKIIKEKQKYKDFLNQQGFKNYEIEIQKSTFEAFKKYMSNFFFLKTVFVFNRLRSFNFNPPSYISKKRLIFNLGDSLDLKKKISLIKKTIYSEIGFKKIFVYNEKTKNKFEFLINKETILSSFLKDNPVFLKFRKTFLVNQKNLTQKLSSFKRITNSYLFKGQEVLVFRN